MNPHLHDDPSDSGNVGDDSGSGSSAIDLHVIQGLRDLGGEDEPGLLDELIEIFLQDAPERMKDIREGMAAGDLARVERGAHTLKSSSANIGALRLSELCSQIVERARKNRTQGLSVLCDASGRSLAQAETELKGLRS